MVALPGPPDPSLLPSATPTLGIPHSSFGKEPACKAGDLGLIPGSEDPLEKGMATHSIILPGEFQGLYSPWGHRVGHDWATFTLTPTITSHYTFFTSISYDHSPSSAINHLISFHTTFKLNGQNHKLDGRQLTSYPEPRLAQLNVAGKPHIHTEQSYFKVMTRHLQVSSYDCQAIILSFFNSFIHSFNTYLDNCFITPFSSNPHLFPLFRLGKWPYFWAP